MTKPTDSDIPAMSDSSRERNETYTSDYSAVLCPYCNESNDLSEAIGRRGENVCDWDCDGCGKKFKVTVDFSISVTAEERP